MDDKKEEEIEGQNNKKVAKVVKIESSKRNKKNI